MRQKAGVSDLWLFFQNTTILSDVLTKLEKERGVKVRMKTPDVAILVNGRRIEFIEGLSTKLKDLDEIDILHIIAGG